jgi:hypothetical protein
MVKIQKNSLFNEDVNLINRNVKKSFMPQDKDLKQKK